MPKNFFAVWGVTVAVEIVDGGQANQVELHPWFHKSGKLRLEFLGDNNRVSLLGMPKHCLGTNIQLGHNSSVEIGEGCNLSNTTIYGAQDCHVLVGAQCTFTARARFIMHEPSRIRIGQDCMIAADVQFMTSDNHTIYDTESQARINPANNIDIGDHVWIGLQCFVMKGARVGRNSIIGLRSVVTREIPENCLAVGAPARVIRENTSWDRKLWPTE